MRFKIVMCACASSALSLAVMPYQHHEHAENKHEWAVRLEHQDL